MMIAAERMKKLLNQIIHLDQNGFLPKGQIINNTRIVTNVLEYYEAHSEKQAALMFLDAQKAFDNFNWDFFIQQIIDMNFGPNFKRMIVAIYSTQKASVILNGDFTERFNITKGVRQGMSVVTSNLYPFNRSITITDQTKKKK
uniref:Reverse transcriptase domain-containing protein n=1 Tax=Micrurus lemniscatus lemniscatus TaxID=129467 RepID=A0A2D4J391_MICLE